MSIKHVTAMLSNRSRVYAWQVAGSKVICERTLYADGEWGPVRVHTWSASWRGEWSPEAVIRWLRGTRVLGAPTPVRGMWQASPGHWQPAPAVAVDYCFPYFNTTGRRGTVMQVCTCDEGRHALATFQSVESAMGSLTPGQVGRMTTDPAVNEYSRAAAVAFAKRMGWGKTAA